MYNLIKIHVKGIFPPHSDKSWFCLDIQQDLFYIFFVYVLIILDLHLLLDDILITHKL